MYRILYRFLASLARLTVRSGRSKNLEIIVLRHQLGVLRRQVDRPELTDTDRTLLAAVAAALPRPSRAGWLVTPDTLLRWHRRRIAPYWTQPQRPPESVAQAVAATESATTATNKGRRAQDATRHLQYHWNVWALSVRVKTAPRSVYVDKKWQAL